MALSPSAQEWIARQCGAQIVEIKQQGRWRPHHYVTLSDGAGSRKILARSPRDPELVADSQFLSHFDLEWEARVLAALQGHDLKIPTFLGFSAEHQLILMDFVEGTNDLSKASDDAARTSIMKEYYEQLARLHSIDVESMKLDGITIPKTPDEIALAGKFRFQEADFRKVQPSLRPEPLLELGLWWVHTNVPTPTRPPSFLQGDTGPGQLMFADDRLTALIDWELAHIGDPMLDLGVARMRNMLYPAGSLREPMAHYEQVSGQPIDRSALLYYTVLSTLLSPLGMAETMQRPSARVGSMIARFGWDVTLRRGLCDALAEALSIELELPDLPSPPATGDPSLIDYLTEHLELECVPLARDDAERFQVDTAIAVARALKLDSEVGQDLLAQDLDDMGAVLGRRPNDRNEGFAQLADLVSERPQDHLPALVSLFSRIERRKEYLWEPLMLAQASGELEHLAPLSQAELECR